MTGPPITVLTAVTGPGEAPLAAGLATCEGVQLVRRCADLGELLGAAAAGLARAAVISADLPRLDRDALARLRGCSVAVVVLAETDDPAAVRRLRALGVTARLPVGSSAADVAAAVRAGASALAAQTTGGVATEGTAVQAAGAPGQGPAGVADLGARSSPGEQAPDGGDRQLSHGSRHPTPTGHPPASHPLAGPLARAQPEVAAPSGAPEAPRAPGPPHAPGALAPGAVAAGSPRVPVVPAGGGTAGPRAARPASEAPAAGKLVAVWGPTGAPGRTTVAVGLATELALAGRSTLLADADTYGPSIAQTLALLDESAGLAAAVRAANQGTLDTQRLARLAPGVQPGLRVLTGIPRAGRWPELRPSGLQVVWQTARAISDWTVVDCGFGLESDEEVSFDVAVPRRNGATLCTLVEADVVVVVGVADPIGLHRLVRGLQDLRELIPATQPRRVVVTRVRDAAVGAPAPRRVADALARYAGVTDAVLVPDDPAACDAALLTGRTLADVAPQSPARRAIAALAADLAGAGPDGATGRSAGRRRLLARARGNGRPSSVRDGAAATG